jgi:hypothetical protein
MTLNKVPFVPNSGPLLGVLDKFQDGRSHMAIVSRFSVERAKSVRKAVKRSLTQRIRQTVGISDDYGSSSESEDSDNETGSTGTGASKPKHRKNTTSDGSVDQDATLRGNFTSEDGPDGDHGSPMSRSVDSGFVGRRMGNGGARPGSGQGRNRRMWRWLKFLIPRTRLAVWGSDCRRKSKSLLRTNAVLAEESANEVRLTLSGSHSRPTMT